MTKNLHDAKFKTNIVPLLIQSFYSEEFIFRMISTILSNSYSLLMSMMNYVNIPLQNSIEMLYCPLFTFINYSLIFGQIIRQFYYFFVRSDIIYF